MLVNVFYMLGFLLIAAELKSLFKPKEQLAVANSLNSKLSKEDESVEDTANKVTKKERNLLFVDIGYLIWLVLGLIFTNEWMLFLAVIGLSIIPKEKLGPSWIVVDAILSIGILSFIIANHFFLSWL